MLWAYGPFCLAPSAMGWHGLVQLDDGAPFLAPAAVTLTCPGQPAMDVRADLNGRFEFDGASPAGDCELIGRLGGYETVSVSAADLPQAPSIPALTLARLGQFQGAAISVTFLAAPPDALAKYHQALRNLAGAEPGTIEKTTELLEQAVDIEPQLADAWYQLGRVRLAANAVEPAKEAFSTAISADPWFVPPYSPMLVITSAESQWERVSGHAERLLAMNPYHTEAHYYAGLAHYHQGDFASAQRALDALERTSESSPFHPADHLRGLLAEAAGDRVAARQAYGNYLQVEPEGIAAPRVRTRLRALDAFPRSAREATP